jgi:hypothetical protein
MEFLGSVRSLHRFPMCMEGTCGRFWPINDTAAGSPCANRGTVGAAGRRATARHQLRQAPVRARERSVLADGVHFVTGLGLSRFTVPLLHQRHPIQLMRSTVAGSDRASSWTGSARAGGSRYDGGSVACMQQWRDGGVMRERGRRSRTGGMTP